MAKVHLEAGPFGLAICGRPNVDTTRISAEVTCGSCKNTTTFIYGVGKARSAKNKKRGARNK